jgi:hypothetical protein
MKVGRLFWRLQGLAVLVMGLLLSTALRAADFPRRRPPIADADPTVHEEREVLVPDGFLAARTADVLAVCEHAGPLKSIKLMVGHKMELGMTIKLYLFPEGTQRPAEPFREGWSTPAPQETSDQAGFYPTAPFGFVERGKPYVVELEIKVFEADPAQRRRFGGKSYKVLWQSTLRQTPKEERELPLALQQQMERREKIKAQPVPWPVIPKEFLKTDSEDGKRILATEITAGFANGTVPNIIQWLAQQAKAEIRLKLKSSDPAKLPLFVHGYERTPLRVVFYEIGQNTGLKAEWKLEQDVPPRVILTD